MKQQLKLCILLSLFLAIFTFAFADIYQIGHGSLSQRESPINGYFGYGWSRTLYSADEFQAVNFTNPGLISAIGHNVDNTPNNYTVNNQRIYIRTTDADEIPNTNYPSLDDFTLVFEGTVVYNGSGWQHVQLDDPFFYDGVSGIEILRENRHGTWASGYPQFASTAASRKTTAKHQDGSYPAGTVVGNYAANRPNVQFTVSEISSTPLMVVDTQPIHFGALAYNATSDTKYVRIGNYGAATLELYPSNFSFTGANADAFSFDTSIFPLSIATAQSVQLPLQMAGTTVGANSGNLVIEYDGESFSIELSGIVLPDGLVEVSIGDGTGSNAATGVPTPYGVYYKTFRQQYLVKATELLDLGGGPGNIYSLGFNVTNLNNVSAMPNYRIRMKHTDQAAFTTNFEVGDYTEVFHADGFIPTLGINTHIFNTPFDWDGNSNIIVDISCHIAGNGNNASVAYTNVGYNAGLRYQNDYTIAGPSSVGTTSMYRSNMTFNMQQLDVIDMAALSLTGPNEFVVNETAQYTVKVKNYTLTATDNYVVKLMKAPDIEIASLPGNLIDPMEEMEYVFDWTADTVETAQLFGRVIYVGDENPLNDNTEIMEVFVLPENLVMIGSGTNNSYMPINANWGYSYAQMLYKADEINTIGQQLEKVAYHWNGAGAAVNSNEWTVYLGHTDKESFTSTSDWIPLSQLNQVYEGTLDIPAINKWIEVPFDVPFVYNGTDNLVIAVRESKPNYDTSSYYFYNSASSSGRSLRYNSDSVLPDPAAPLGGTLTAAYPNIRMFFGEPSADAALAVMTNSLNFGTIFFDETSDAQNVSLSNVGAGTLHLAASDLSFTGANADLFGFDDSAFPIALEIGEVAHIPVFVVGTTEGDVSAALEIHYDGDTHSVELSARVLPQGIVIIGDGTATQRYPLGSSYGFERSAALYTSEEIGKAGVIDNIGWYCTATNPQTLPFKVYIGSTDDDIFTQKYYDDFIEDFELVLDTERVFDEIGWNMIDLTTPYEYAGGNLIIVVETNFGGNGGNGSALNVRYTGNNSSKHILWQADHNAPTVLGTVNANRPNVLIALGGFGGDPMLALYPGADYEFPLTMINTTSSKVFTLSNIGGGTIDVTQMSFSSDSFALASEFSPFTIESGEMYNVETHYSPLTAGDHQASFTIQTGAGNRSIELSGSCFDPTIVELPYTENFDGVSIPDVPLGWTILNPDNPAVKWMTSTNSPHSSPNSMRVGYTPASGGPLDDWFITPPISMEAGKEYRISYYYRAAGNYNEKLAFKAGTSPVAEDMTETLIDHGVFRHNAYEHVQVVYSPDADGSYFFGWHAYSDANQLGINVDNVMIEELISTPSLAVEPASHQFDALAINYTASKNIIVSNVGGGNLVVTAINISGDEIFSLDSLPELPITLTRDEEISFNVVFAPTEAGDFASTIAITANDDTHTVSIAGLSIDPTISVFPFFEGFEDGYTHEVPIDIFWTQFTGPQFATKLWTANNTYTNYNRTPRSGEWNAFLQYSGQSMLVRPIMLAANQEYKLTFHARQDGGTPSNAKIRAMLGTGNTLDELTEVIVPETNLSSGNYQELSGVFSSETGGLHYIGIGGWINGSPWYISLDDISIDYNYIADPNVAADLGDDTSVTITGGGFIGALEVPTAPESLTPIPNPAFITVNHQVWKLVGTGTVTLTFQNDSTDDMWFSYVVGGAWAAQELAAGANVDITIDLDAKDATLEFALGKGGNPTLPVELSYFNAVFMVSESSVKLSWKTASESQMLGYQIYRSRDTSLTNASLITGKLVEATNSSNGADYSFMDSDIEDGTYYYWLEAVSYSSSDYYGYQTVVVDIPSTPELPQISSMSNAYPNPFRGATTIDIAVKAGESGSFTIYNMLGQAVYSKKLSEGNLKIEWNGRDKNGARCGSGVYFYKLTTPSKSETKKMLIMK